MSFGIHQRQPCISSSDCSARRGALDLQLHGLSVFEPELCLRDPSVPLNPTPQPVPDEAERFVKRVFVSPDGLPTREQFPKTVPFTESRGRWCYANPLLLQHCCGARHTPAAQNLRYSIPSRATTAIPDTATPDRVFRQTRQAALFVQIPKFSRERGCEIDEGHLCHEW
jgi:hypothetical protein